MASLDEIRKARIEKINILQARGLNSYPAITDRNFSLSEIIEKFEVLSKLESIVLAGRVMAIRGQGAIVFFNINDGTATFQGLLKKMRWRQKYLICFLIRLTLEIL